ncbi:MAG: putative Rossmann fold flavoprotein [Lentisphaeria bacterium]|jgi:predicted Rossmann fold flavoprotein
MNDTAPNRTLDSTSDSAPGSSAKSYDVIIIGAGAAGLMCAATAGKRGRTVLVLDHANKVGKKILMSGGGRCNFTNTVVEPGNYLSVNPHFCKSALSRYTPYDFLALVGEYQLAYHEKSKGQLFCDDKAGDILTILLEECRKAGAIIRTKCGVETITACQPGFTLQSDIGPLTCQSLVVATGGLSIPTMGASGKGYNIAKQFGLRCTELDAALVPFTLQDKWLKIAAEMSGVSLDVEASCQGQSFNEALLFTHRGLSGPAILQISNYWHKGDEVLVDFLPSGDITERMNEWRCDGQKSELKNLLARHLPKRFVSAWLALTVANKPANQYSDKEIAQVHASIHRWSLVPPGTEGYRTAEVTRGGVDTSEISSKTFEAKKVPGLYFVGEVLDVTGWLGGFNFQWAWASGYCAGECV